MCVLTPLIFYFGHQWGRHYYKSKIENMADKNGDGFSSDEEIRKEIVNVQSDAREFNDLSYWEMKKYVDDYRND